MSDIFHEVEEEVRKERYQEIWKRYGTLIVAGATLVVAAVAGYQAWQSYETRQREEYSARFDAAVQTAAGGNFAAAETEFTTLAADAPGGYAELAKFRLAQTQLAQNKRDEAIATLRELTQEEDPLLSSAARLRLAWTLADTAPRQEIETLIAPISGADNLWRFSAAELRAYLTMQSGNRADAQAAYTRLSTEADAAEGLRRRAGAIAQFLRANPTSTPAMPAAAAPAAAAPAAAPVVTQTPAPSAVAPPAPAASAPPQETPPQ